MNRAVVALLVSVSLLGCFPHSPQKRTYAKIGEGTAIVAGIAISAFANTAADCDQMEVTGINNNSSCESGAKWATTAGVVLIVGGLLGFVATVSTAEDEKAAPKAVEIKEVTQAKPEEKAAPAPLVAAPAAEPAAATTTDNTQATDPNAAGSAATPTAPQK